MELRDRVISHFADNIQVQQETMGSLSELIEYASHHILNALLNDRKVVALSLIHI